jgi:hypothetical protein
MTSPDENRPTADKGLNPSRRALLAIAGCLVAAVAAWPQSADDSLDPVKVSPATQRLILENDLVRVVENTVPPGVAEPRHRHRHGVVVYLTDFTTEQVTDSGRKTTASRQAGTAAWSEALVHTLKNVGTTPVHAIRVELKF